MPRFLDPSVRGIVLLALLVLVEGIQLAIVLGLISSFVPFRLDPFDVDLFPVYKNSLKPNYQMLIYHIFIVACFLAQAIGIYAFRREIGDGGFQNDIKRLLRVDALWVFIQCFAIFKILIYGGPAWAWGLFYASLAASMLSRIFWVEIKRFFSLPLVGRVREGVNREITFLTPAHPPPSRGRDYLYGHHYLFSSNPSRYLSVLIGYAGL